MGLVGEILGWWNELGVLVSLAGLMAGLFSALDRNGQLLLEDQSATHDRQESMLSNQERMLENQERMIDGLEQISQTLDDRLPEG